MTLKNQQELKEREERIIRLKYYCQKKYKDVYTPELFQIFLAGYELCRKRRIRNINK